MSADELAVRRAEFDRQKAVAKTLRESLDIDKITTAGA
jgi:hypothetical protein